MRKYSEQIIKTERNRLQQVFEEYKGETMMIKTLKEQSLIATVGAEFLSALLKNEEQEKPKVPKSFVKWMKNNNHSQNKVKSFEELISNAYHLPRYGNTELYRYIKNNPLKISELGDIYINGVEYDVLKEYKIAIPGFVSDNGQQYLTLQIGNYFACAKNSRLKQTFLEDELKDVPEYYRQFAEEVN